MSVFRFSERVPKIACMLLPTSSTRPPEGLELALVRPVDVLDADAQPGDAGVQVGDVAPAAEGEHQLLGEPVGRVLPRLAGLGGVLLAARVFRLNSLMSRVKTTKYSTK